MDYPFIKNCSLFAGIPADELRKILESAAQHVQYYEKGETVFHFMEPASRIGIIMEGKIRSVKPFPNGSLVDVASRLPGDMIGPAAVFSANRQYPCDVVADEPSTIMMFQKEDILALLQTDVRILENFTRELATAAYMLQERLELLSYHGIAQKAAFYLMLQKRKSGRDTVQIPRSISNWALVLDVSRPSLHRKLKKMEAAGIIRCNAHSISILDEDSLNRIILHLPPESAETSRQTL